MNSTRKVAERVRPYLRAMEESISAARQQRLHGKDEPAPAPQTPPSPPRPNDVPAQEEQPQQAPRLRARPKRPSSFVSSFEEARPQTRAG